MKWISLNEQTPQNGQYVLVTVEKKRSPHRVFVACYSEFHHLFVIGYRNHERKIKYWMPLPQPHKEE